VVPAIVAKLAGSTIALREELQQELEKQPKVTGSGVGEAGLGHAPESLPRTYIPDDDGVSIEELPDGVRLKGLTEKETGITKTIEIHLLYGANIPSGQD
jgi:hypothetical protein